MAATPTPIHIEYDDDKHAYKIDGEPVPGVTSILDETVSKPALPWWGMRVGMAAVIHAMQTSGWAALANANTYAEILSGVPHPDRQFFGPSDTAKKKPKTLVEMLAIKNKLSTNHVKEEAGDRGTAIHAALEELAAGVVPSVDEFPPEHRGFIQGLCRWWLDQEPEFVENEVIVGSRRHRYAGRFDFVAIPQAGAHEGQRGLIDLKTSKRVYMTHLIQLDGYEVAYEEMEAGDPFDFKQVLHVPGDGTYALKDSKIPKGAFIKRVELYHQMQLEKKLHPDCT